jgi:subtilisin-like proprotein convertase family protein
MPVRRISTAMVLLAVLSVIGSTNSAQQPAFSITDVTSPEGSLGRNTFAFTVSLANAAPGVEHRVSYRTADGTAVAATVTRTQVTPAAIPIIGTASPYPITLEITGLSGAIDEVAVRLDDLTHTYPEDLDVLLVGPGGHASMFMSDVGGWDDVANIDVTFRDGAPPAPARHLTTGTFAPSNISPFESLPAPAPPGPYPVPLSVFNGTNPNGTWSLYIEDDFTTDVGTLAGFTLIFSLSGAGDYLPVEGQLVFPPGTTALQVNVPVKGDTAVEPSETFAVNLSAPVNAAIADGAAVGTILNDDGHGVPVAIGDNYLVQFGTPLAVGPPGVLANDIDNDGGPMTAVLVSNVAHGTLSLSAAGGFVYTANAGYAGADSFVYRAATSFGSSNDATVTLSVAVPVTLDDTFTAAANTPLAIGPPGVLANDDSNGGGVMTSALVAGPLHGTVTLNAEGSFAYVPAQDFVGADGFRYRAVTVRGAGNTATAVINVVPPTNAQAPTSLRVDSVAGHLVTLRFSPPVLGPRPTGFVVKGGRLPHEVIAAIPTSSTAPVFTFVAPTGSFFIRVHTLVGEEESAASNEVPLHVNVPVVPSAPVNLIGLVNGSSVALAWKNTFGGGPPSDVILSVRGSLTLETRIGRSETFSFASVPPGTYTMRVRGINRGGWGPSSNPVTLTFPGACSGAPQPPANLLGYRVGRRVFVLWDPPAAGAAPTTYTLNVTGAIAGSFPTAGRALSGDVGPGSYKLEVVARNACGTSPPTAPQTVVVP